MKILNLTKSTLWFRRETPSQLGHIGIPPAPIDVRVEKSYCTRYERAHSMEEDVYAPIYNRVCKYIITGLPDPEEGTIYVVSEEVLKAVRNRSDVYVYSGGNLIHGDVEPSSTVYLRGDEPRG